MAASPLSGANPHAIKQDVLFFVLLFQVKAHHGRLAACPVDAPDLHAVQPPATLTAVLSIADHKCFVQSFSDFLEVPLIFIFRIAIPPAIIQAA